jgi:alkylated DNA repair protein (DNA oxidative demethylase)
VINSQGASIALTLRDGRQEYNASMTLDLFPDEPAVEPGEEPIAPGAVLLRGFAQSRGPALLEAVSAVTSQSPFRFMSTPGGFQMSVAMTNCGAAGWITDRTGYRYGPIDPLTGRHWPAMPAVLATLAVAASARAGFGSFTPDACLINRYEPGSRMSLHQDRNELDFTAPIVSVSLGLPAVFLFGGDRRADKPQRVALAHGDVVVWGGPARLRFHGVLPLQDGEHPLTGRRRINLTFRKAL